MLGWLEPVRAWLSNDGALILPQIQLAIFALGLLLTDFWLDEKQKSWNAWTALAGIGYTLLTGSEVPTVRSCIAALLVQDKVLLPGGHAPFAEVPDRFLAAALPFLLR